METNLTMPEWMTPAQFAAEMLVTARTVRRWCEDGIIPAHCIRQARATLRIHRDALRYLTPTQETHDGTHDAGTPAR